MTYDCIVVGGGAAGLSAALVLGRARRRTLLVDAGAPSNRVAHGIGGLLGYDGRPPADLYAAGAAELAAYPSVERRAGTVVGGERRGEAVELELDDGTRETARRVVLATGMDYGVPDVPGAAERWGRSVFHCPFCHGWEVRERPLGVLQRGAQGAERAVLLRMWSDDVTLFADGPAELADDDAERLRAAGVHVEERRIAELRGPGDALSAVVFADGGERRCEGLLVPAALEPRSDLAERLGASEDGPVRLAGDAAGVMPSVPNAIAAGATAAAMVVHGLMDELAAAPRSAAA
jgi:thioredoxin reductase